jgi:plasmid stabilization system protein ParE
VTRYVLTADAEQDLDVIKAYLLGQGGTSLVRHVFNRLQQAMEFLGRMPGAGHLREDLTGENVKFWQEFSYLIVYNPAPRPVHIIRVLHSSQDVAAILEPNRR